MSEPCDYDVFRSHTFGSDPAFIYETPLHLHYQPVFGDKMENSSYVYFLIKGNVDSYLYPCQVDKGPEWPTFISGWCTGVCEILWSTDCISIYLIQWMSIRLWQWLV